MKILGIILLVPFFILMFLLIISTNNTLECYFFYHKEWILWEKVIKNFDKKIFNFKYDTGDVSYHIKIDNVVFTMYHWANGSVSLHDNNEFCLSPYDEYHQKKLKKLFEKESI